MSWINLAFSSVFFFTSLNLLQRLIAVDSKNPRATAILFNSIAAILAICIYLISGSYNYFALPSNYQAWLTILAASFFYGMFERGRFKAAKLLDASILTTISNISVLIAFIGSLFLYSERLTTEKLIGGTMIIGALLIVSFNNRVGKISLKGIILAILIYIMLGLAWMLDKLGTQYFNANTYSILVWTVPLLFICFPSIKFEIIKLELKAASWKIFLLAGLNVVGYLIQLKALELAEATKVIPIIQTATIFTVVMGIFFLKERTNIKKKLLAGLLAMIGVFLLI